MKRPKIHRNSITLDMTAMCDVAFLLLTFFMLTAKFKPDEADKILLPSAHNENACRAFMFGDKTLTITINQYGKAFLEFSEDINKNLIINSIENNKRITFTPNEKLTFMKTTFIDYPINHLKSVLNSSVSTKNNGINYTEINNELFDWVLSIRVAEPNLKVAIKGDSRANYSSISEIISTLQSQNVNVFKLITEYEKPIS